QPKGLQLGIQLLVLVAEGLGQCCHLVSFFCSTGRHPKYSCRHDEGYTQMTSPSLRWSKQQKDGRPMRN
ncbi:MAG: hypothetical protein ACM3MF_07590, partial [Anaerolineae bacterium]